MNRCNFAIAAVCQFSEFQVKRTIADYRIGRESVRRRLRIGFLQSSDCDWTLDKAPRELPPLTICVVHGNVTSENTEHETKKGPKTRNLTRHSKPIEDNLSH